MKKNKFAIAGLVIAVIVLIAGIGTSIYFALMSYKQMQEVSQYIEEVKEAEKPEETRENDVKIAGSYEIKSTEAISDAYKSGDTSELDDKQKETFDLASGILKEIITDGMSDIEKETAVYDWMCANLGHDSNLLLVIPDGNAGADTPYGVLKYHNAVCVGYATTFRMFMQMLDIECKVVHNTECYHSWDLVKIDGDWYHTDIYADAGTGNYANFNVPDVMRMRSENWDMDYFPHATSLKYNKAMKNLETAEGIGDIPSLIAKHLQDGAFLVRFNESVDEKYARRAVEVIEMFSQFINGAEFGDYRYWGVNGSWVQDPENGGFMLYVNVYGEPVDSSQENANALSDEERDNIQQIINELVNDIAESLGGSYSGGYYNDIDNGEMDMFGGRG